ncbi:FecCD family ABC transporter permease [Cohnella boryungensis]|uniref:FecCD family ABC transporter permease n=1 Tax=Cohnella boryungensis TaxID=768479 RepID=A0ABV8SC39_9BACL
MKLRWTGLAVLLVLVAAAFILNMCLGLSRIDAKTVWQAFTAFDGSRDHLIVRSVRLPRALIALMVGCSLALAGAIMQALTRNPLAGPEIFGVNYGAALAAVVASFVLGFSSLQLFVWSAFAGTAVVGIAIIALISLGRAAITPSKLVLAGATINLLLAALTQGILILNQQSLDTMRYWLAGSLTGRELGLFLQVLPYMLAGLIGALLMSKQMDTLSLGDDTARSLGQRVMRTKLLMIVLVIVLTGSSVAIAGPIGFVGLAVPHIAKYFTGSDYRWILPYSAGLGALLLLLTDIGARFALPSQEVPVGVVTAFLGAPVLIYIAQRREGLK